MPNKISSFIKKHKKLSIIIASAVVVIIGGIVAFALIGGGNNEPGSAGWNKSHYGPICEAAMKGRGLETNTTEYSVCTRDLGYDIKGIEPPVYSGSTSTETEPTQTIPTVSESQIEKGQRLGCATTRAISLDDQIATNKRLGVSESDTRIVYQSAIALCDSLGY